MLQHQGGVLIIYKNESSENALNEKITFTLDGLTIDGNEPDNKVVEFSLNPGQEKIVKLSTIKGGFTFNMQTQYSIDMANF